ncbi:hypothetical protein H9L39_05960 [Fusarium oxysporum f. sp. albedinis]|nr:hypothetical protein H9L39_05960 [Fusarium oxysporum f. sp. albedinis]
MIFRTLGGITKPRWVNLSLGGAGSTAVPCGGLCRSGVGTPIKGSSKASTSTADPLPLSLPRNREVSRVSASSTHHTIFPDLSLLEAVYKRPVKEN